MTATLAGCPGCNPLTGRDPVSDYYAAALARCKHCGFMPVDDDAVPGLCQECADLAVWGGGCADCEHVPTGRELLTDYALSVAIGWPDRESAIAVAMAERIER